MCKQIKTFIITFRSTRVLRLWGGDHGCDVERRHGPAVAQLLYQVYGVQRAAQADVLPPHPRPEETILPATLPKVCKTPINLPPQTPTLSGTSKGKIVFMQQKPTQGSNVLPPHLSKENPNHFDNLST